MIIIRLAFESASDTARGREINRHSQRITADVCFKFKLSAAERVDNQVRHLFW